jgi:hypothetical protein
MAGRTPPKKQHLAASLRVGPVGDEDIVQTRISG